MARKICGKRSERQGYQSDEEWGYCVPYLELMKEGAPQRQYPMRTIFNAIRYLIRAGCPWRMLPNDFPPWQGVYQQAQRWIKAGCFEAMAHDLRKLLRFLSGKNLSLQPLFLMEAPFNQRRKAEPVQDTMAISVKKI